MEVIVKNPTKAILQGASAEEIAKITKLLSYTNKSIAFQISKHHKNFRWKNKDRVGWQVALDKLEPKLKHCLLKHDGNNYCLPPGIVSYLGQFHINVQNEIHYPEFKPLKWATKPDFEPFPYQTQSVERLIEAKHGNVSLPTGCGKSFILLLLAQQMGLDTVVVTPSQSIFTELLTEFKLRLGDKVVGGYGDGYKDLGNKVTIAIGKSLTMLEEGSKAYEFFKNKQVVLVDESHTFAAEQLNDVCHGVLGDVPYRMFVSATQTRNDGTEKLLASIIGENVLDMGLKEAIDQGYLCPLNFTIIATISPDSRTIKDPTICKRRHFLYNPKIADIAAKIANAAWNVKQQSTLILVEELEQIEMLTKLLKVPYAYVHSADKKKAAEFKLEKVNLQESVRKFNTGEVKVLIGTKAIATGTNLYPTHNCINWMGGSSEIVTKQGAMGRSTRRLEISKFKHLHTPKPFTMVYDFRVRGVDQLDKQLIKRCGFYQEAGGEIKYY
jgi:superfamily II DNA or RNA helicase